MPFQIGTFRDVDDPRARGQQAVVAVQWQSTSAPCTYCVSRQPRRPAPTASGIRPCHGRRRPHPPADLMPAITLTNGPWPIGTAACRKTSELRLPDMPPPEIPASATATVSQRARRVHADPSTCRPACQPPRASRARRRAKSGAQSSSPSRRVRSPAAATDAGLWAIDRRSANCCVHSAPRRERARSCACSMHAWTRIPYHLTDADADASLPAPCIKGRRDAVTPSPRQPKVSPDCLRT